MRRVLESLLPAVLLVSVSAWAIPHARADVQPAPAVQFERLEGLSHNSVFTILQDQRGFLWIGTADGDWSVAASDGVLSIAPSNGDGFFGWDQAGTVAVEPVEGPPSAFALRAAYPNLFTTQVTLPFDAPEPVHVRLGIYDVLVGDARIVDAVSPLHNNKPGLIRLVLFASAVGSSAASRSPCRVERWSWNRTPIADSNLRTQSAIRHSTSSA